MPLLRVEALAIRVNIATRAPTRRRAGLALASLVLGTLVIALVIALFSPPWSAILAVIWGLNLLWLARIQRAHRKQRRNGRLLFALLPQLAQTDLPAARYDHIYDN